MSLSNQVKNENNEPLFVIVKHAGSSHWEHYFVDDPVRTGVVDDHNAAYTYTGEELNLPKCGLTKEQAQEWLVKMNQSNPSVGYDICPLIK